jgi:hypothetical protein
MVSSYQKKKKKKITLNIYIENSKKKKIQKHLEELQIFTHARLSKYTFHIIFTPVQYITSVTYNTSSEMTIANLTEGNSRLHVIKPAK